MINFFVAYAIFLVLALFIRSIYNLYVFTSQTEGFIWIYNEYLIKLFNKLKKENINDVLRFRLKEDKKVIFEFTFCSYEDALWQTIMHIDWLINKYERAKWLTKGTILPEMRLNLETIYASCINRLEEIEKAKKD